MDPPCLRRPVGCSSGFCVGGAVHPPPSPVSFFSLNVRMLTCKPSGLFALLHFLALFFFFAQIRSSQDQPFFIPPTFCPVRPRVAFLTIFGAILWSSVLTTFYLLGVSGTFSGPVMPGFPFSLPYPNLSTAHFFVGALGSPSLSLDIVLAARLDGDLPNFSCFFLVTPKAHASMRFAGPFPVCVLHPPQCLARQYLSVCFPIPFLNPLSASG